MTEYVTVVSVDMEAVQKDHESKKYLETNIHNVDHNDHHKSPFVTVLTINNSSDNYDKAGLASNYVPEIVAVYRLPGERLGFGLKFQGGTKTDEKIKRLFIQSCAPDSPASRARASWGQLEEFDEILEIDGESVTNMTRIECVKCLKNNNLAINLLVRKRGFDGGGLANEEMDNDPNEQTKKRLPPEPPKVPPRKINRKSSADNIPVTNVTSVCAVPPAPMEIPVVAEMYQNALDEELNHRDNESDDTGSTISTVISNFSSETDLTNMVSTSPATINQLAKPFQLIEREFGCLKNHLLNEVEPIELICGDKIKIDVKSHGNYENIVVDVPDPPPRQYENIELKAPPVPRPRFANSSYPQKTQFVEPDIEKSPKTKTITIESWLKDANKTTTINGHDLKTTIEAKTINFERNYRNNNNVTQSTDIYENNKSDPVELTTTDAVALSSSPLSDDISSNSSNGDVEKSYEPIKFECFAAGGDDDELGPPELLNISEAYFNFSWCSAMLPTIGEAEEEFASLEPQNHHFADKIPINGPILIVNSADDIDIDSNKENQVLNIEEKAITTTNNNNNNNSNKFNANNLLSVEKTVERYSTSEINNNSLYLQQKLSHSDNNDKNLNNRKYNSNLSNGSVVVDVKTAVLEFTEQTSVRKIVETTENSNSFRSEYANSVNRSLDSVKCSDSLLNDAPKIIMEIMDTTSVGTTGSIPEISDEITYESKVENIEIEPSNSVDDDSSIAKMNEHFEEHSESIRKLGESIEKFGENIEALSRHEKPIIISSSVTIDGENQKTTFQSENNENVECNPINQTPQSDEIDGQTIDKNLKCDVNENIEKAIEKQQCFVASENNEIVDGNVKNNNKSEIDLLPIQNENDNNVIQADNERIILGNESTPENDSTEINCENRQDDSVEINNKQNENIDKSNETAENVTETFKEMTSSLTFGPAAATKLDKLLLTPEFSRLPPDGHEFPPNFQELKDNYSNGTEKMVNGECYIDNQNQKQLKMTPTAVVVPLVPRKSLQDKMLTSKPPTNNLRKSSTSWRKDEKSEKSVKDKIAMFSNSSTDISQFLPKTPFKDSNSASKKRSSLTKSIENIYSSSPNSYNHNSFSGSTKKKAMSVENLDEHDGLELRKEKQDIHSSPLVSKSRAFSVEDLLDNEKSNYETATLPRTKPDPQSLSRRISFSGYTNNQIEERRKSSISSLLESRKKSMSKLRGLVIPEKVPENEIQPEQKVYGLPVIRSKDIERVNVFNRTVSSPAIKTNNVPLVNSGHKKSFDDKYLIPESRNKYSSELGIGTRTSPPVPPLKPPRTSLILLKNVVTDESDTDSVLSSRVSTPPISPVQKTPTPLVRTFSSETNTSISSNSTLTSGSGSQASCSSVGSTTPTVDLSRKISNKSSEALANRKSVLASSKNRSGRDNYEKTWRDGDSTDGGIDEDERRRTPKAKIRTSLTNYKVVGPNENLVDKVINVATYVEVLTSDSDDRSDIHEPVNIDHEQTIKSSKSYKNENSSLSDMAKWVRNESSKTLIDTNSKNNKESQDSRAFARNQEQNKKLNLSEIRKNFENKSPQIMSPVRTSKEKLTPSHNRFSSWDSVASSSSGVSSELLGTGTGAITNTSESLQTLQSDFGSFSSFGSSHSLITQQDIQVIIEEADPPLQTPEAFVVVLQRETPESSVGITLAGGSDYEAKEITIHKILANFPADKDGRLRRGDRILAINGLSMRGLTHRESLSVLKAPRPDVVLVVTRSKSVVKTSPLPKRSSVGSLSSLVEKSDTGDADDTTTLKNQYNASRSLDILDSVCDEDDTIKIKSRIDSKAARKSDVITQRCEVKSEKGAIQTIEIIKDGAGLGFSIDGGYDSPKGNLPLLIKKIFMGGAAEKSSNLRVGDEILEINDVLIDKMTRIDVWNMMKQLPQGDPVKLKIKKM